MINRLYLNKLINRLNFKVYRKYSQSQIKDCKPIYEDFINSKRKEATKSLVVQVSSEKSFAELYNYCSQFGDVIGAHHYKIPSEDLNYIIIEFNDEICAKDSIKSAIHNENISGTPTYSQFLWFKATPKTKKKFSTEKPEKILKCTNGLDVLSDTDLFSLLRSAQSLDDQLEILYNLIKLNDLGLRLRLIAANQIENSISGMFPFARATPFGSSVNGFGKLGCDLDLILRFDDNCSERETKMTNSRLVFHIKENLSNGRSQIQRQMESIGDMLQLFLPGISNVRRILQARVPIIKFHHEHLDLEVDLSMNNLTGAYMSELFYIFGEIDDRVRPLTFCLRKWAQSVSLTNPSPGRWITNFSLTCLVLFFLQQMKKPILPSINLLIKSATPGDSRITEEGINCTFLRDFNQLKFKTSNESTTSELLLQFFEFFSQFDFQNRAISLNEGQSIIKPDHSAIYIVNPFEQDLNVSKNISFEECERLRIEVRNAAWILESELDNNSKDSNNKDSEPWGLLNLFRNSEKTIIRPNMFFRPRMVDVKELFNKVNSNGKLDKIKFKNHNVKHQIQNIKNKYKADLKEIQQNELNQNIVTYPKDER